MKKNTTELIKFVGHNRPKELYIEWFPSYFVDKINNRFITKEYFEQEYKKDPILKNLAKKFKISAKNVSKIKDFYSKEGIILDKSNYIGKIMPIPTKTNNNKRYMYNLTTREQRMVDLKDIDSYINNGWQLGTLLPELDEKEVYSSLLQLRDYTLLSAKFNIGVKTMKRFLQFTGKETKANLIKPLTGEVTKIKMTNKIKNYFLNNGWEENP